MSRLPLCPIAGCRCDYSRRLPKAGKLESVRWFTREGSYHGNVRETVWLRRHHRPLRERPLREVPARLPGCCWRSSGKRRRSRSIFKRLLHASLLSLLIARNIFPRMLITEP